MPIDCPLVLEHVIFCLTKISPSLCCNLIFSLAILILIFQCHAIHMWLEKKIIDIQFEVHITKRRVLKSSPSSPYAQHMRRYFGQFTSQNIQFCKLKSKKSNNMFYLEWGSKEFDQLPSIVTIKYVLVFSWLKLDSVGGWMLGKYIRNRVNKNFRRRCKQVEEVVGALS